MILERNLNYLATVMYYDVLYMALCFYDYLHENCATEHYKKTHRHYILLHCSFFADYLN